MSSASTQSATQSIEGVLIVSPWKMPSISLPPLVRRKIFGSGRSGVKLSSRSTARGLRIRTPWPPSPPIAFCQEKVVTSSFAQGRSCAKAAEVASQKVRPARSAAIQSASGHAGARGGAVPGEADVGVRADRAEVRQRAVGRGQHPRVGELELLGRVGGPALAEALPDQHVDRARAEHRPHRHLEGAGVGGGHDADAVVLGHAEQLRGAVDRLLQLRLRLRGAVRAAEEGARGDRLGGPAGPLRAGTRGELGARRLGLGFGGGRDDGGLGMAHRPAPRSGRGH